MNNIKIFSGTSNIPLAEAICKKLRTKLGGLDIKRFSDGEIFVEVNESVRGSDCFVVQSTSSPVNENLLELFVIVDALKEPPPKKYTQ